MTAYPSDAANALLGEVCRVEREHFERVSYARAERGRDFEYVCDGCSDVSDVDAPCDASKLARVVRAAVECVAEWKDDRGRTLLEVMARELEAE